MGCGNTQGYSGREVNPRPYVRSGACEFGGDEYDEKSCGWVGY